MAHDMWRDVFVPKRRVALSRRSRVLGEHVGDAVTSQRLAMSIEERALPTGSA